MEQVIRNVAEIDAADRRAIEHVVGRQLPDHQQIVITVLNRDLAPPDQTAVSAAGDVPSWWNLHEGLSDHEVERLDQAIRPRANLTRHHG